MAVKRGPETVEREGGEDERDGHRADDTRRERRFNGQDAANEQGQHEPDEQQRKARVGPAVDGITEAQNKEDGGIVVYQRERVAILSTAVAADVEDGCIAIDLDNERGGHVGGTGVDFQFLFGSIELRVAKEENK